MLSSKTTRAEATLDLAEFGWELDFDDIREPGTEPGEIVGTEPAAGTDLEEGEVLSVFVSLGEPTISVPQLDGLSLDDARVKLEGVGLAAGTIHQQEHEDVPMGFVIDVIVGVGVTQLEPGSTVDLLVSSGPTDRAIPEVIEGLTLADAALLLNDLRLDAFEVHEFHEDVPVGDVIRFEPSSSALVPVDTLVTVVISDGPEPRPVPEVIGLDVDEATRILQDEGFVVTGVQGDPSRPVLATDPLAGELHEKGTAVVIATQLNP